MRYRLKFYCNIYCNKTKNRKGDEKLAYGYIYLITNTKNKKKYVGLTTRSLEKRFKEHCVAETYLGNAIRKHGEHSFNIGIIDQADNHQELTEKEIHWIHKLGTFGEKGYNQTIGGDGASTQKILDIKLNNRQKGFVEFVNRENKRQLDVNDKNELATFTVLNLMQVYLLCRFEKDKKRSAELIYDLKPQYKESIFKLRVFTPEEVAEWL